jgi:hypothetical protein
MVSVDVFLLSAIHRNAALADRHARQIERERELKRYSIYWKRRRADGRYSLRGHHFNFWHRSEEDIYEWIATVYPSPKKSNRNFAVIVTARSAEEAQEVAYGFLHDTPATRHLSLPSASTNIRVARGKKTNEEVGEAELRSKSKRR